MNYLAAALIALWLVVGLFVAYMWMRQRRLEQEIQSLEEQLNEQQRRNRT